MKTRDKILFASLALFNEEGEPNVTTVDIASEIDISPGNLYYHFKGKSSIIIELYENFQSELVDILNAPVDTLSGDDSWIYIYILFEQIYQFRFFYQNQHDILRRIPELQRPFKRLLNRKFAAMVALMMSIREKEMIDITDDTIGAVAENMVLQLTHWLNYLNMRSGETDENLMLHRGVFQLSTMLLPYVTPQYRSTEDVLRQVYFDKIAGKS